MNNIKEGVDMSKEDENKYTTPLKRMWEKIKENK